MVRMKGDGNIEYIGRIDSQVKIRGYRARFPTPFPQASPPDSPLFFHLAYLSAVLYVCVEDPHRIDGFPHVVDAQDRGAPLAWEVPLGR